MNILTGYIVKEVLKGSFLALLLLLTLFNLYSFSDELKDLGKGNYQLREIFIYLALNTPAVFHDIVPSGALIGSIFVLGAMANNSEIIAMRAAGLSVFWIIRSVMLAGVFLVLISVLIGEFIAPDAQKAAQLLKTTTQNDRVVMLAKYGIWLREGNHFVNIRQMTGKSELTDISFFQLDKNHHLTQVKHAQTGKFLGHDQWQLQNIQTTQLFNGSTSASHVDEERWRTSIAPDLLDIVVVTAANLSTYDLAKYIDFLKDNNQKSQTFEAAFWTRVLNPFVTFVMLLVSTPFVIGIKRGTGVGGRLVIGIVIGLSFNILDQIIGHIGIVYNLNPLVMALLPSALVLIAALYAINRLKQ
jgi:lipopolysaccharide export system permease protein